MQKRKMFLLLLPTVLLTWYSLIASLTAPALGEETKPSMIETASNKSSSIDSSLPVPEASDQISTRKQSGQQKASPKTDTNPVGRESIPKPAIGKHEAEQDIMERALDLISYSQEAWVIGDIEGALNALDQAYAILLDTNGDVDIARQKDDLRLLISKKILAIYTSKNMATAGKQSEIPMIMNAEVEKEIRSFQTIERDFFIAAYQRSSIFRPVILKALKKAGLPEELSWLPLVESGYKIRALSKARALGLWQFIPSTGYKYGLNRDDWIDERMDVEKATQGAIGYLKDLHDMFGDWLTVLAAYNCGEGRVIRVISGQHINYLDRFWDLYNQLPNETARYVPRFLATLHIIKDPQKYGFNFEKPSESPSLYAYSTVTTNSCMNLQDIANRLDMSEELLSTLNAELRHQKTPDKQYSLKIPAECVDKFYTVVDAIPKAEVPRAANIQRVTLIRHKVRKGETVNSIAKRYDLSLSTVKSYNKQLAKSGLTAGSYLTIPVRNKRSAKADEVGGKSGKKNQASSGYVRYTVKKGDTLFSLSKQFDTPISEIKKINNIKGDSLKIGDTLKFNKA